MRELNPITRVELSEKNKTLRWIAAIALFVIGAVGITVGIMGLLNQETGWQKVQISTQERSCSENFILQYNFAGSPADATAVNSKLQQTYGAACVKAYQLFTPDESIDGVNNVYYLNHHINEVVTVDPVLYAAFQKMDGTPWLYMGPAYAYYYSVIYNAEDVMVPELDPDTSAEARAFVEKIAFFAGDRNAVNLELLGNNQVKLHVSQEYQAFAKEEEIETFIDFAYLTNAFTIDYLAQELIDQNLTDGYIVSADGYTRNLCSGIRFNFNIFDRIENTIYPAGVMVYEGPVSIVYLKDYPTADSDSNYRGNGNSFIHTFADPADGMHRTSVENLVSYSYTDGCADVALKMLPGFVGEQFALPEDVFSVWCQDDTIYYNDGEITIAELLNSQEIAYRAVLTQ